MNTAPSTTTSPLPNAERVKAQIEQLSEQLAARMPGYESLLHTIHRNLAEDPETVHLLSDEEIGVIVAGLQKKTGIVIAALETKKASGKGKGGKVGVEDL